MTKKRDDHSRKPPECGQRQPDGRRVVRASGGDLWIVLWMDRSAHVQEQVMFSTEIFDE
jgi:hypothetical protein